jgi:hypothetical protein
MMNLIELKPFYLLIRLLALRRLVVPFVGVNQKSEHSFVDLCNDCTQQDVAKLVSCVEHNHFFVTLPPQLVQIMCKLITLETFAPDTIIFNQGDIGEK